ncbi:hypothetical protein CHARACLAT_029792 [Characodon lateralis]|uniref:Uncharacterized protein n=1 Tax=Characodon lateralis TaxID=208331 RepID=A0ABU7E6K6_9TELE|nr:hypothetical protein [Characodon lateralis]
MRNLRSAASYSRSSKTVRNRARMHEKERVALLELETLICTLSEVFLRIVGERRNFVLASMPVFFFRSQGEGEDAEPITSQGYPGGPLQFHVLRRTYDPRCQSVWQGDQA